MQRMCYSAIVVEGWREFCRRSAVQVSLVDFARLYQERVAQPAQVRLPRGFDLEFTPPASEPERQIRALVDQYRQAQSRRLEAELFTQRRRLADAQRRLAVKQTKSAAESSRIATARAEQILGKLALLRDERRHANDYRIFPRSHAPLIVMRDGRRTLVPARYLLRQPGASPRADDRLGGNYNARRDNLTRFWRRQFGVSHAVLVISSFFENVTGADGVNRVLQFTPRPAEPMWIACLCAEWSDRGSGERLLSFAAITDEPPAEVAAAGHDRMIVSLAPGAVDDWLTPQGRPDGQLQAILDDRQRPVYEHRIAA